MKKGYTLIEILVSLTIIGLLFSFGFVSFREFSRRQALTVAVRTVQADLRLAQQKALSGEKPESCTILAGYNFRIDSTITYSINANCSPTNPPTVKNVTLGSDFTISATNNPVVIFKVLGQGANISTGPQTIITLTQISTGKPMTITVTSGGEIR